MAPVSGQQSHLYTKALEHLSMDFSETEPAEFLGAFRAGRLLLWYTDAWFFSIDLYNMGE